MSQLTNKNYDVVIIGGGIHGVGVAQAAAAAGYSVALLEQNALASGTSSRSSKLIHGGLRYLESAQFSVVRECLRERTLLLELAPELVKLQYFNIPVYKETTRRPWQLQIGLSLYALLTGMHRSARFSRVPKSKWESLDGLDTKGLQSVFRYYDAQTDDALLTRAVMNSAQELGAELLMPCELVGAELGDDYSSITYHHENNEETINARVIVNAAGPWANRVLEKITPAAKSLPMELVQGSHIVIDGKTEKGIYYMEAPRDKRAVFLMPWKDKALVGTTETVFQGDPGDVQPLASEEEYLLETVAHYFPRYRDNRREDIVERFAGLRVLPSSGTSPFSRSRETILHPDRHNKPRLLTIYGGKLTAYRATAEKVIQRIEESLPMRKPVANTRKLKLSPP